MTIGEELSKARRKKGIDIKAAEEATKIRAKFLEALENDNLSDVPEPVYVKGFIRTYASFLGLDGHKLIKQYQSIYEPPPKPKEKQPPVSEKSLREETSNEITEKVAIKGGEVKPTLTVAPKNRFPWVITLFAMVLVAIIILGVLGSINPHPATERNSVKVEKSKPHLNKKPPPPIQGIIISVIAREEVWIRIRQDGLLRFIGIMKPKQKIRTHAKKQVIIETVNGNALRIYKNHKYAGIMSPNRALARQIYTK